MSGVILIKLHTRNDYRINKGTFQSDFSRAKMRSADWSRATHFPTTQASTRNLRIPSTRNTLAGKENQRAQRLAAFLPDRFVSSQRKSDPRRWSSQLFYLNVYDNEITYIVKLSIGIRDFLSLISKMKVSKTQ